MIIFERQERVTVHRAANGKRETDNEKSTKQET